MNLSSRLAPCWLGMWPPLGARQQKEAGSIRDLVLVAFPKKPLQLLLFMDENSRLTVVWIASYRSVPLHN